MISDIVCSTFFFILTMYGSIMGGTGNVKVTREGNINQAMGVASTDQHKDKVTRRNMKQQNREAKTKKKQRKAMKQSIHNHGSGLNGIFICA